MSKSIYFIDTKLSDYQSIIDTLSTTDTYYLIDADTDGLTQMSTILSSYRNLDAIHVFSHGSVGSLNLGSTIYNQSNISSYELFLQQIGSSLSANGDILLYGCNVAHGDIGQVFIDTISSYTGADVAASDDITGSSALGGNWELESTAGAVEDTVIKVTDYNNILVTDITLRPLGVIMTSLGKYAEANSVAIQADGKIVVAGTVGNDDNSDGYYDDSSDFALARYNTDGSLDISFDGNGLLSTDILLHDGVYDVAIQPNGKIVVAGYSDNDNGYFSLARYNTDGSLDTIFGSDGKVITDISSSSLYDYANSVAIQADGKIVAVGGSDFSLALYNSDGSNAGVAVTDFESYHSAESVAIQADGKIVIAGSDNNGFVLIRYNANGTGDTSFGGDAVITTEFGSANSVAIQADGKIVAAGFYNNDFALARYNTDGSLDTSFGGDGKVTTDFGAQANAESITIQADGKIVVAGYTTDHDIYDFALARYNSDGSLDTSFGGDGKVTTRFGLSSEAHSVTIQTDGKIVVSGYGYVNNDYDCNFAVARYNSDGSLDDTFSNATINASWRDEIHIGSVANNDLLSFEASFVAVKVNLSLTTPQNTGGSGKDTIIGFENLIGSLFNDTITGDLSNNTLDGSEGADKMSGGLGNDIYVVDDIKDVVTEKVGQGTDTIQTSLSAYSIDKLTAIENITYMGSINSILTGNKINNILTGSSGNDIVDGQLGNDTLIGVLGNDIFKFTTKLNSTNNVDTIADFTIGDSIGLGIKIFTKLKTGITDANICINVAPTESNDYIIYNTSTNTLSYDADGSGTKSVAVAFAVLVGVDTISASDFQII